MYDFWYKIVMFDGDDSVKADFRESYLENLFPQFENKSILGVDFSLKNIIVDGNHVKFDIWDLSSEERFEELIPYFGKSARAAILIIKLQDNMMLSKL